MRLEFLVALFSVLGVFAAPLPEGTGAFQSKETQDTDQSQNQKLTTYWYQFRQMEVWTTHNSWLVGGT